MEKSFLEKNYSPVSVGKETRAQKHLICIYVHYVPNLAKVLSFRYTVQGIALFYEQKRLILLDVLVFILLVGSYLSTTLSWFLFSKSAIQKQTHFLSEQISTSIVSNETTMAQETARYQGLSDYQFSYFSSEGGDPIEDSTGDTSPLTKMI